jgi:Protein of unknown function (DUF2950)
MNRITSIIKISFGHSVLIGWSFILLLAMASQTSAENGRTFASPEEAVSVLTTAVEAKDHDALRVIFGPAEKEIKNPDPVQAANEFTSFAAALSETNRVVRESDTKYVVEIGNDFWPFPIPLVKQDERWFFDTNAGKEEILNRRIGRNELSTLKVVRAYVAAQREYASLDRNGDEVLQYARKFISSPGTKDGLYWPPDLDGEISPLGPLVAHAQGEGYMQSNDVKAVTEPYHGYYFKILTGQGRHAPGGKYSYIINGNMIGGFALVAWPARYGESGVMTLIVNQQGRVYQRDLGPHTGKLAPALKEYDPDPTWRISPD